MLMWIKAGNRSFPLLYKEDLLNPDMKELSSSFKVCSLCKTPRQIFCIHLFCRLQSNKALLCEELLFDVFVLFVCFFFFDSSLEDFIMYMLFMLQVIPEISYSFHILPVLLAHMIRPPILDNVLLVHLMIIIF